jgi:hypothetical protein
VRAKNSSKGTPCHEFTRTVCKLCKPLFGKLIANRGYISQPLFEQLLETFNVQLITRLKKNMKNRLMPLFDNLLLRKRAIIESVIDQLQSGYALITFHVWVVNLRSTF